MKTTRMQVWLGAAALALFGLAGKAQASGPISSTATLNIDVTVTANLSVNINTSNTSTQTVAFSGTPNELLVSPSTVAVQNNSGVLSERWKLSTIAQTIDETGATPWSLAASTSAVGQDSFAVQAVFGSSNTVAAGCPASAGTEWNSNVTAPPLSTTAAQYTSTAFADATLNNNGSYQPDVLGTGYMYASSVRVLCWRIVAPASVTTTDTQNVQIVVTAY